MGHQMVWRALGPRFLSPHSKRSWASCHPQDLPALEEEPTTDLHLLRTSFSPHNYVISHGWLWGAKLSFVSLLRGLEHPHRSTWGWGLLRTRPPPRVRSLQAASMSSQYREAWVPPPCFLWVPETAKAGPSSTWQAGNG